MAAYDIIQKYIAFFEKHGHTRIAPAPLVPFNDPTTLFTSSGMQPLVPYLLGESHPSGTRLVNTQNVFRAVDIEEVGDDRHTTFFRMLGNWSLGDYFKKEQIAWMWELYTKVFQIDPQKLYISIFSGYESLPEDTEAREIWTHLLTASGLHPEERIFAYGVEKNWWSRSGTPDKMPAGEPGGPDSEIFYDFGADLGLHEKSQWKDEKCHPNCDCGRYWEIGNSVFMQYIKQADGSFAALPKQNVDFGGGLERILGAAENTSDMFLTSLFEPTIRAIEKSTGKKYEEYKKQMQIIADHFGGSIVMVASGVKPANKEQGYILRRLLRRSLDKVWQLNKDAEVKPIIETIVAQYKDTDPYLVKQFEEILLTIQTEQQNYEKTLASAKKLIEKDLIKGGLKLGDELMGLVEISAETAFKAISSYGLSPTQLESLGYTFNQQELAEKIKQHQTLSRSNSQQKFAGGLADHQERTIMGHTATHLLQQALRDVLGDHVHQTGSNITTERLRFDFSHPDKLTDEQMKKVATIVNEKIQANLPVHFEMLPLKEAKATGAIGLFDEKYEQKVKVYFIGGSGKEGDHTAYSKEFCGGPHVHFTSLIKSFRIIKQEKIGNDQQRIYAVVHEE